jgi:putative heme iron utilization protein
MEIGEYFKTAKGTGALAMADSKGVVDVAIFAVPHLIDHETIVFIMTEKLAHQNLQSNPHAAYLFMEDEDPWQIISGTMGEKS